MYDAAVELIRGCVSMVERIREEATVLIVDDQRQLADALAIHLADKYEVLVAYSGQEALDTIDNNVDVVLLDRRMPAISGDEVLKEIRGRGYDCRVVMVTAVEPDFDVVDLSIGEYLHKPVDTDELERAIERQLLAATTDAPVDEYVGTRSVLQVLEKTKPVSELEKDGRFEQLRTKLDGLERRLDETDEMTTEVIRSV